MSRLSAAYCMPSTRLQADQNGNFRRRVKFIPRPRFPEIESCSGAMTGKSTPLIGMPDTGCGKRRAKLKSGLLRWFAVESSFSGVRTRGFTPLTQRVGGHGGSRNLAGESIPLFMPPSSNSIWDAETANCIAWARHPEKHCGVHPRAMASTHLRPWLVTCS